MKSLFALPLVLALVCTSTSRADDEIKDPELAKLQGTWTAQQRDPQGNAITITKVVRGKRQYFTITHGDDFVQKHHVDFDIEKTASARVFTYRNLTITAGPNAGRVQKHPVSYLYQITDDTWTCIFNAMPGDKDAVEIEVFHRIQPDPAAVTAQ